MSQKAPAKNKSIISSRRNLREVNEIIEIKEVPSTRQVKITEKRKDSNENCSSEATTPNKKKKNKKKGETELIEIMDAEKTENNNYGKKKPSAPTNKRKKSIYNPLDRDRAKKNERTLFKSVCKVSGKDKSHLAKGKKGKKGKINTITLEESDSEIQVTTEVKVGSSKTKDISKIQDKKGDNKSRDTPNGLNKKNKKNGKIANKNEEEKVCKLTDNEKENGSRFIYPKKKKYNNKTNKSFSNKANSGYFSSRKCSKKKQKNPTDNQDLKSKSTIKLILNEDVKNEMKKKLLGRKRKVDNIDDPTPIKKAGKPEIQNKKSQFQPPASQRKETKLKSNSSFQNYSSNNLFAPKMGNDFKSLRNFSTPELAVLNQLIIEFGFEEVLDTLCKPKLDQNNKLDSCLQGLKDSCDNEKLPIILVRMMFSYFESKFGGNKIKEVKRSSSAKKLSIVKSLPENGSANKEALPSNNISKSPKDNNNNENKDAPIQIEDKDNEDAKGKNNNMPSKKYTSIGSHYHKKEDGKIYKYQVSNLDGKGNAIFKCYDDRCSGIGLYGLESKKFEERRKHSFKHSEHDYIIDFDLHVDTAFKALLDSEKTDAQVFRENGKRSLKLY